MRRIGLVIIVVMLTPILMPRPPLFSISYPEVSTDSNHIPRGIRPSLPMRIPMPNITDIYKVRTPRDIVLDIRFTPLHFQRSDVGILPIARNTRIENVGGFFLPVNITVVRLPYSAKNISVDIESITEESIDIPKPGLRIHKPGVFLGFVNVDREGIGHQSNAFVQWDVYSGVDPERLVMSKFLVIRIYPLRILDRNSGAFVSYVRLRIKYQTEEKFLVMASEKYDILIITSRDLALAAEKLKAIKERDGFSVYIKYVEDIYNSYDGRDRPEKIRNFIKYMKENHDISYLIILGDSDIVPVRYAYIPDGAFDHDPEIDGLFVETDLYYADLDYTWNDDNNSRWGDLENDKVDGVPDIFVGRLPVSNLTEALGVINKIEHYKPIDILYSRVLFAGTDTFMIGYPEGEYLLEYSEKYVKNATITKIYETFGNLTRSTFIKEMDEGYSIVAFTGHGMPDSLVLSFSQTYSIGDALRQRNRILPVFVALSCDAGRFAGLDGVGEALVINPNGGAIAFIGSTRIAWGYIGELVTTGLMGEMFWRTIKALYDESLGGYLGRVWAEALREYIMNNPIQRTLAGYYLDWKTVAEFTLLGDPTLNVRYISKNTTDEIGGMVENSELILDNKTVILSEDLTAKNSTLRIVDSILVMNGSQLFMENSTLIVNNSIIIGDRIVAENSTIIIDNSSIIPEVSITNSTLETNNSVLDSIMIMDDRSDLSISNSSTTLILANCSVNITDWKSGYIDGADLSVLGITGGVSRSYVGLEIEFVGITAEIRNSTLIGVEIHNGKLNISLSLVGKTVILNSSVIIIDTNTTIQMVIENSSGIEVELNKGVFEDKELSISNIDLSLRNVFVGSWNIVLHNSTVSVYNSTLGILETGDSTVSVNRTSTVILKDNGSVLSIMNSTLMLTMSSGNITLLCSNITTVVSDRGHIVVGDGSRIYVMHGEGASLLMNSSRIYQLYLENGSEATIDNSTIVEAVLMDSVNMTINHSKLAVVDCGNGSSLTVDNSKVLYWLRIYQGSSIVARDSVIWFGLVFKNSSIMFEDLMSGKIIEENMSRDIYGWELFLSNVTVLGWDIISFSSSITISNSEIGWVFAYYNSGISVRSSMVSLLRLTHNSIGNVDDCIIGRVLTSGRSNLTVTGSSINSVYALGESHVKILGSVCDIVAGMGTDAEIEIYDSHCGYVAAIENVTMLVDRSVLIAYLSFSEISYTFKGLAPEYVVNWDSTRELSLSTNWVVNITDSWVSWAIDAEDSNIEIRDCMLMDLYVTESEVNIINTSITSYFVAFSSEVTIGNSSIYGIDISWGSRITLTDTVAPTLYLVDSEVRSSGSLLGVILYLMNGTYMFRDLTPGVYEEYRFSVDEAGISIELSNTSLFGWVIFGIGLMGRVDITVENSTLMAVGLAYNGSLKIIDTKIYGFLEAILTSQFDTNIEIVDTICRLYLFLEGYEERVHIHGFDSIEWDYTGNITSDIILDNVTIYDFHLSTYHTNITIEDSEIGSIDAMGGDVEVYRSNLESLSATMCNINVEESNISSLSTHGSYLSIQHSTIGRLCPMFSQLDIAESKVGVDIMVIHSSLEVRGLEPSEYGVLYVPQDIPLLATGIMRNVEITAWYISVNDLSYVKVSNSSIEKISPVGHKYVLTVNNSRVGTIVASGEGSVSIWDSEIGLELDIKTLRISITKLHEGIANITSRSIFGYPEPPIDLAIRDTNITMMNVSISNSIVSITNIYTTLLMVENSYLNMENASILQAVAYTSSRITIRNSWIRLFSSGIGSSVYAYRTSIGLIAMFIYANTTEELPSGGDITYSNIQTHSRYILTESRLIDWSVVAGYVANISIENMSLFMVGSEGLGRLWLKDVFVEYPVDAFDLSETHILFHVEIEVLYDFMRPNKASITINGKGANITVDVEGGQYEVLLHQAIIRSYERVDLGEYTITAKVGLFSGSKEIYLWRRTRVRIYIVGPLTIGTLTIIIAIVILRASWMKEKISRLLRKEHKAKGDMEEATQ